MQQYVDIYSLSRHSTCFGCHAPIIRSTKNCICYLWLRHAVKYRLKLLIFFCLLTVDSNVWFHVFLFPGVHVSNVVAIYPLKIFIQ